MPESFSNFENLKTLFFLVQKLLKSNVLIAGRLLISIFFFTPQQQPIFCELIKKVGRFCGKKGTVVCRVRLDRGGYVPGESIKINARVENHSRITMKSSKATLNETIKYGSTLEILFGGPLWRSSLEILKNEKAPIFWLFVTYWTVLFLRFATGTYRRWTARYCIQRTKSWRVSREVRGLIFWDNFKTILRRFRCVLKTILRRSLGVRRILVPFSKWFDSNHLRLIWG